MSQTFFNVWPFVYGLIVYFGDYLIRVYPGGGLLMIQM